jgi:hypothetical protein
MYKKRPKLVICAKEGQELVECAISSTVVYTMSKMKYYQAQGRILCGLFNLWDFKM